MRRNLLTWFFSTILIVFRWKRKIVKANVNFLNFPYPHLYSKLVMNLATEFSTWLLRSPRDLITFTPRLESVLPELRKGGLLMTAHFGNWEMLPPILISQGVPLMASYAPIKPPFLNRLLIKLRSAPKPYVFAFDQNPMALKTHLRNGSLLTFVVDQDFRNPRRVISQFMGQDVSCNSLPIFVQKHLQGRGSFFCWTKRLSNGVLQVDGIRLGENLYEDYHRQLELLIHDNPTQWAGWTHRRFKSMREDMYN